MIRPAKLLTVTVFTLLQQTLLASVLFSGVPNPSVKQHRTKGDLTLNTCPLTHTLPPSLYFHHTHTWYSISLSLSHTHTHTHFILSLKHTLIQMQTLTLWEPGLTRVNSGYTNWKRAVRNRGCGE